MEILIEVKKDLSSCQFKKGNKVIEWSDLTREEQLKLLNSIACHYNLFNRFIKPK